MISVCVSELHTKACFGITGKIAMDLPIGTSYIHRCTCGLFPPRLKVVPEHSCLVKVLTSLPKVMSLLMEDIRHEVAAYNLGCLRYFLSPTAHYNSTAVHKSSDYRNFYSR